MKTCGAKTRSGGQCKRRPAKGSSRCKLHGGYSLKGTDSPRYKHGLYSKHVGSQLREVIAELDNISDDELIEPTHEIKLMQALIISAKALKNEVSDLRDLDIISKVIDRLISAKQRSQMIMTEQQKLIPASDVSRLLDFMENLLAEKIGNDQATVIISQLQTFRLSQN